MCIAELKTGINEDYLEFSTLPTKCIINIVYYLIIL